MTIEDLFTYFDNLVESGSDDELFASSYIKGFVSLHDERKSGQILATDFHQLIAGELANSKSELTPQDYRIVSNFWLSLAYKFS